MAKEALMLAHQWIPRIDKVGAAITAIEEYERESK
jgi:hypothetical protein